MLAPVGTVQHTGRTRVDTLTGDERTLLDWIRVQAAGLAEIASDFAPGSRVGWRYSSVHELLLAHGRFFTPRATSPTALGQPRECYNNASTRADADDSAVYVEGLAVNADSLCLDVGHAWCASGAVAVDPTWADGRAYLGVPLVDAFRRHRQAKTGYWSVLWSPDAHELLRDGVPDDAVADVGRPLPSSPS
jgi:hypothetical protein